MTGPHEAAPSRSRGTRHDLQCMQPGLDPFGHERDLGFGEPVGACRVPPAAESGCDLADPAARLGGFQTAFGGERQQRFNFVGQFVGPHDRGRAGAPLIGGRVDVECRAERPESTVGQEAVVAEMIVGVAERHARDHPIEQRTLIRGGRAGQVAHGRGDVGVVAMVAVRGSQRRQRADVAQPALLRVAVEAAQQQHTPPTDAHESTPRGRDPDSLEEIERTGSLAKWRGANLVELPNILGPSGSSAFSDKDVYVFTRNVGHIVLYGGHLVRAWEEDAVDYSRIRCRRDAGISLNGLQRGYLRRIRIAA